MCRLGHLRRRRSGDSGAAAGHRHQNNAAQTTLVGLPQFTSEAMRGQGSAFAFPGSDQVDGPSGTARLGTGSGVCQVQAPKGFFPEGSVSPDVPMETPAPSWRTPLKPLLRSAAADDDASE